MHRGDAGRTTDQRVMAGIDSGAHEAVLRPGQRLRELLARKDAVLPVLGVPTARYGKIMKATGTVAGFVGTSITYGNYTGLPDTGVGIRTGMRCNRWTDRSCGRLPADPRRRHRTRRQGGGHPPGAGLHTRGTGRSATGRSTT